MHNNRFNSRIRYDQGIVNLLSKVGDFRALWQGGLRLSPQILGRLKSWVIITSAGASTRIEGSKMSDKEVGRLLRGLKTKKPKGRDAQEVAGYADLIGRIFDNYKTLKLTENNILQFHNIQLKFSEKDEYHRGKYKTSDNTVVMKTPEGQNVVLFQPTPPYLVKPEMEAIIAWTNEQLEKDEIHPLLVIANFVFEFLAIHPFSDGNGRLSRALTNLLLLRTGYTYVPYVSLEEIVEQRKIDYYLALRATQKHHKTKEEDISAWVKFFLETLVEQAERARKLMEMEQPEKLLSEKQAQVYQLFKAENELGVKEIDEKLKGSIPKVTIKQALNRLVELKLIERLGMGRGIRYKRL
jgi:Fic family protein